MSITALINKHPALTYFALTFAISWGGVVIVVGPGGFPGTSEQLTTLLPFAILAMLAGPSVAGLLLTALLDGSPGLREFRSRLLARQVGARWYAVALLIAPLVLMMELLVLSRVSAAFLPGILTTSDKTSHVLMGIATGLAAGFVEELGWTGFAVPRLRRRHGILKTGLIVGLLWAAWHMLVGFWASGPTAGAFVRAGFLLDPFLFLVAFRVLMVWVYDRTRSLLVAMVMHVSLTTSIRILGPVGMAGMALLTFDLVWAAALWVVVGAVAYRTTTIGARQNAARSAVGSRTLT